MKIFAWQCDPYNSLTRMIQRVHFGYHCQRTKVILAASLFFPDTWNRWFSFSGYGRWNISHIYSDKISLENQSWAILEKKRFATNVEHAQLCYVSHSSHINLVCTVLRLFSKRLVAGRDSGPESYYRRKTIQAVKRQLNSLESLLATKRWPKSLSTLGIRLLTHESGFYQIL